MQNTTQNTMQNTMQNNFSVTPIDDKDAFEGISAIKEGYKSLENRNEQNRNFLGRLPLGIFYESSNNEIDNASARLNKYYGRNIIDKNVRNEENRRSLQNVFHNNIGNIASKLQQAAVASGDIYSAYRIFDLTHKLISMPIDSYDNKTVYRMLDELDYLKNTVGSGVPLGIAINNSSTIKNIDNIHSQYMSDFAKSQIGDHGEYEESLHSFIRGGIRGFGETAGRSADRILNVMRWVTNTGESQSTIMDQLNKILPDLTREEQLSVSGMSGRFMGSFLSALSLYGIPDTAKKMMVFAAIPRGVELLQSVLGLDDSVMDKMLGVADMYALGRRGSAFGNKIGEYVKNKWNEGEYLQTESEWNSYPKLGGFVGNNSTNPDAIDIMNDAMKNIGENLENMDSKASAKFSSSFESTFNEAGMKNDHIYSPPEANTVTSNIISEATKTGTLIPSLYTEASERSGALADGLAELEKSNDVHYVRIATETRQNQKMSVTNGILKSSLGDDYRDVPTTKDACGESIKEFETELYGTIRSTASRLYDEIDLEIQNSSDLIPEKSDVYEKIRNNIIGLEDSILKVSGLSDSEAIAKKRSIELLKTGMSNIGSYIAQLHTAAGESNIVEVTKAYKQITSDASKVQRQLGMSGRTLENSELSKAMSTIKDYRKKLFKLLEPHIPGIQKKLSEADVFYRENKGELDSIISRSSKTSRDINHINNMTNESAYRNITAEGSSLRRITKLASKFAPSNKSVTDRYNTMIKRIKATEMNKANISVDNKETNSPMALVKAAARQGPLGRIAEIDSGFQDIIDQAGKLWNNYKINSTIKMNPSFTAKYFGNQVRDIVKKTPIIRNIYDYIEGSTSEQRHELIAESLKFSAENPDACNILETANYIANIKGVGMSSVAHALRGLRQPRKKEEEEEEEE